MLIILAPLTLLAWLLAWIFHFGPTLINDEYAAIDYFYRIMQKGEFYPTPYRLHKPLSLVLGLSSYVTDSPLGFEIVTAVFGTAFICLLFIAVKKEMGAIPALAAAMAVAASPDLIYYSATGSTIMPFCALSFAGLNAVQRRDESPNWLWVYAASFLLAGLLRPESWLFAAPMIIWWWPAGKGRGAWIRLGIAASIIMLGPVIWFGKDLLINGDILHGIKVATHDKLVGTGKPFTVFESLNFFWVRIPNKTSWPVALAGVAGMAIFIENKGWLKGLFHPFVVYPLIVSAYVWLIVYMGVYPVQRYWYFDAVFAIIFCVLMLKTFILRMDVSRLQIARAAIFFLALIAALGFFLTRPGSNPPDARWLLVATGTASVAACALLLWSKDLSSRPLPMIMVGGIALVLISYPSFLTGFYQAEFSELRLEAEIQKEMVEVSNLLERELDIDSDLRILIPSRRNEQLNWLMRNREAPEVITFREAFYLDFFKKIDFLELHPDWIVYINEDYQFWGPQKEFAWLNYQDNTTLQGVEISLVTDTGHIRVFRVTYPAGHAPRGPLPSIP